MKNILTTLMFLLAASMAWQADAAPWQFTSCEEVQCGGGGACVVRFVQNCVLFCDYEPWILCSE